MARVTAMQAVEAKIEKAQEAVSKKKKNMMRQLLSSVICWTSGMPFGGMNWSKPL